MLRYLLRRLLLAVPVVWLALTAVFLLLFVVPGDPVDVLGGERAVGPATRTAIEQRYGLDDPWYDQYGRYWQRLLRGDLGHSYQEGRSVNAVVRQAAPASLRLALWAVAFEVGLGVAAGVIGVATRRPLIDSLVLVSTIVAVAVPVFVLGYLLQYMFGVYTFQRDYPEWARLPVQGIGPDSWLFGVLPTGGQWRYLVLPAVTLGATHAAVVARLARAAMAEVAGSDYVRAATAKGLGSAQVLLRHGLKNVSIPVVTLIGLDFAGFVGSAIVTEAVFGWPGIGTAVLRGANSLDAPVVLGLTITVVLASVLVNLLMDIAYALLDPRVRYGRHGVT